MGKVAYLVQLRKYEKIVDKVTDAKKQGKFYQKLNEWYANYPIENKKKKNGGNQ